MFTFCLLYHLADLQLNWGSSSHVLQVPAVWQNYSWAAPTPYMHIGRSMAIAFGLLAIAVMLLLASRLRWVSSQTLQDLANIAGIVAMLAAVVAFLIPVVSQPESKPASTPQVTAQPSPDPTSTPSAQKVQWIPDNDGRGIAGLCINNWVMSPNGPVCPESVDFVSWSQLKDELQEKVLPQVRNVPEGSTLALKDSQGQQNWIIQVIEPSGNEVANIWIGNDPSNNWSYDGLIHVGYPYAPLVVWATFQRYSDGSYLKQ